MFKTIFRTMLFVLTLAAFQSLATNVASACDYRYVNVTMWETRQVCSTIWVTAYDSYGCAHRVPKTIYNTVRVPVTTTVKVYY